MDNKTVIIENAKFDPWRGDFEAAYWCLKARSTDATRAAICGCLAQNGLLICTDGYRLHMTRLVLADVPDGFYKVTSINKKNIVLTCADNRFPQYELLLDELTPALLRNLDTRGSFHPCLYRLFTELKKCMNVDYVRDITGDDVGDWAVYSDGEKRPVFFCDVNMDERHNDKIAFLMPMLLEA